MSDTVTGNSMHRLFIFWLFCLILLLSGLIWAYNALQPDAATLRTAIPAASTAAPQTPPQMMPALPEAAVPPHDAEGAACLLTAFSHQGLRQIIEAPGFILQGPGNTLTAQLILRGPTPEILSDHLSIAYALDPDYVHDLQSTPTGELKAASDAAGKPLPGAFSARVNALPLTTNGTFAPYPTALVTARATKTAAQTRVVLPVSTETGCRNCHTGPWATENKTGISAATGNDILSIHDRRNNTDLRKSAVTEAVLCASCHEENASLPNLSTAIHGFHAAMRLEGAEACGLCHASADTGSTRFFRGLHADRGLDCTHCHGTLNDHALSLLRHEAARGVTISSKRLSGIPPILANSVEAITPRQPGVNLPACQGCHDFSAKPDPSEASAFNKWTETREERFSFALDNTGTLRCPSCHGSAHALYPAGDNRDNLQPLQYQKLAEPLGKDGKCAICHVDDMDGFVHHDLP